MAKKPKTAATTINVALLTAILSATDTPSAGAGFMYVNGADVAPLRTYTPPLVEVNESMADPNDASKFATRITQDGRNYLMSAQSAAANVPATPQVSASVSPFAIMKGLVIPPSKRGGAGKRGGAPKVYPFDTMEIGDSFFVPKDEKHPDPVKTLGSTVSSANLRYSEGTGEFEEKTRTKRGDGNKAVKDEQGNKVKETVKIEKRRALRKFTMRSIKAGDKLGDWVAPSDGALIARIAVE